MRPIIGVNGDCLWLCGDVCHSPPSISAPRSHGKLRSMLTGIDDFLDRRLLSYFYHQNAWGYGKKVKKQSQLVTEPSGGSLERAVNRYSRQKRAYENHMKTWRANASYEFLFDPPDLKNYAVASEIRRSR